MNSANELRAVLQVALDLHKAGKLEEAERLYQQVLERDPDNPTALHLRGLLAVQQEQPEAAVGWLEKAIGRNPRSAVCHRDLGLVFCGLEQFEKAVCAFRAALEMQPQFAEALWNWGDLYREFCYFDEAARCYEQALAQQPQLAGALQSLSAVRKTQEDLLVSIEALRNAASVAGSDRPKIERRELLPHVLNQLGLTGLGAEVGVKEGKFSERILRHWKGKTLYSIDPWREFSDSEYADISNVPQAKQDALYRETIQRLAPFQRRSIIWRLTSKEAAELLPDNRLDFCYIDADHSYQGVSEDIRLWFPKIRPGGILAGHDYVPDGNYWFGAFGVQRAVHEFISASKLDLFISREGECVVNSKGESGFPSWFVVKR